jgi:ketosteroid isomerase-like protein
MNATEKLLHERAIEAVLVAYATALDSKDYALLEQVFVADATAHYGAVGECHGLEQIVALVSGVLAQCECTQHLLGNYRITVDGDRATAACYLQAMHQGKGRFEHALLTLWGEYTDELRLTGQGWRIVRRELRTLYSQGEIGLGLSEAVG